jgi:hypothetical protein
MKIPLSQDPQKHTIELKLTSEDPESHRKDTIELEFSTGNGNEGGLRDGNGF